MEGGGRDITSDRALGASSQIATTREAWAATGKLLLAHHAKICLIRRPEDPSWDVSICWTHRRRRGRSRQQWATSVCDEA
eukprot:8505651-Pyramimonas_sp.AAC.1